MRIFIVLGILSLLAACSETEQASETAQTPKSIAPIDQAQKTTASEVKAMGPEAAVLQFQGGLPDKTDPDWKSKVSEPAMMPFEAGQSYFWELKTNHGTMTFRLFQESAPKHVNSTVYLTMTMSCFIALFLALWRKAAIQPARVGVVQGTNMMASLPLGCLIPSQAC